MSEGEVLQQQVNDLRGRVEMLESVIKLLEKQQHPILYPVPMPTPVYPPQPWWSYQVTTCGDPFTASGGVSYRT